MNTVINQLVKEAAYHAAKYDSTINAIRSIASSNVRANTVKTADWNDIAQAVQPYLEASWDQADNVVNGAANAIGTGLNNMWNETKDFTNQWLADGADAIAKNPTLQGLIGAAQGLGQQGDVIGAGLAGAAGGGLAIQKAMEKDMSAQAAEYAKQLAAKSSLLNQNNAVINDLKGQLGAANAQNADLLANAGARFQNAGNAVMDKLRGLGGDIASAGASAKDKLMSMGGAAMQAVKDHPYIAGGLGLAGAGAAALPFLLGGEKEGSYDPYKLQVLRSVLSGM